MKKVLLFTILFSCFFLILSSRVISAVEDDYSVDGGRITYEFEERSSVQPFSLYSEFGHYPWIMDGKLYAWTLEEQKIILKDKTYENVDVSVDIHTINKCGKFDSGIYIGASNVSAAKDGITAWNVNIEHDASTQIMSLKLHRFEDGGWKGAVVEVFGLPYYGDTIKLRVVVKDGKLMAFINQIKKPQLTYNVGITKGLVGLRNYYSPNSFDNLVIIGEGNAIDNQLMQAYVAQGEEALTKVLVNECTEEINSGLQLATDAKTQKEVDEATKTLQTALDRAVEKHTFAELSELIVKVNDLSNDNLYTANSWNSLQAVLQISCKLTDQSNEYEISYWYIQLSKRLNGLIRYLSEDQK